MDEPRRKHGHGCNCPQRVGACGVCAGYGTIWCLAGRDGPGVGVEATPILVPRQLPLPYCHSYVRYRPGGPDATVAHVMVAAGYRGGACGGQRLLGEGAPRHHAGAHGARTGQRHRTTLMARRAGGGRIRVCERVCVIPRAAGRRRHRPRGVSVFHTGCVVCGTGSDGSAGTCVPPAAQAGNKLSRGAAPFRRWGFSCCRGLSRRCRKSFPVCWPPRAT